MKSQTVQKLRHMSDADWNALTLLCAATALRRPGGFGDDLWGRERGSGNCSCPYARQAGKVLKQLERHLYAEWIVEGEGYDRSWGWRATRCGREALAVYRQHNRLQ